MEVLSAREPSKSGVPIMSAYESAEAHAASASERWPAPLTVTEWDEAYPGIIDGIGIIAGPANVIMQLAHPGIGYGVADSRVESGALFRHPIKRARTTLTYLAVAMLGTAEEKQAYRKAVSKVHAQVYSLEDSPVKYRALDPDLQLWVAACLYWGVEDMMNRLRGAQLDPAKNEELYQRLATLGTTLQVRPDMWPKDREAFEAYWQEGLSKVHIDDHVRAYLQALTNFKMVYPWLRFPAAQVSRLVTAGLLPEPIREQMQFPWDEKRQKRFDRFFAVVRTVNRLMPRFVRIGPTWLVMQDFRYRLRHDLPLV